MAGRHVWQGVCMAVGVCGGEGACVAGETATAVDGTHPTGMHSCYNVNRVFHKLHNAIMPT